MRRAIQNEFRKHFFGKFFNDIIGYWRIYERLKLKYLSKTKGVTTIKSQSEFWHSILGDKFAGQVETSNIFSLRDGQILKLKDFFMTEWAPKLPGQIWTTKGAEDLIEGVKRVDNFIEFNDKLYRVLDPEGKKRVVSAGYGSIRLNPSINNDDFYMYLNLVSVEKWHCDYGIPIVVSKSVYNEFCKYSELGIAWVESLEGVLVFQKDLPFKRIIPQAIGAKISKETEDTLRYCPFLPKCFIYVSSPLSVKLRYHDKHPDCIAWTMFETNLKKEPYSLTYTKFNPLSKESIKDAVEFINYYVGAYGGTRIITDFDGMQPRLNAEIPINRNPVSTKVKEFKKVLLKSDKWVRLILEE